MLEPVIILGPPCGICMQNVWDVKSLENKTMATAWGFRRGGISYLLLLTYLPAIQDEDDLYAAMPWEG